MRRFTFKKTKKQKKKRKEEVWGVWDCGGED
jgi:hypothetical protein